MRKYIYLCENDDGVRFWCLSKCKGWRIIKKELYRFTESGLC